VSEDKAKLDDLGRRAIACPRWRWMEGMMTHTRLRIVRVHGGVIEAYDSTVWSWETANKCIEIDALPDFSEPALPDLSDPSTLGCLLALVREAHNAPHAWVEVRYGQRARVLSPENYSEGARMLSEWTIGTEAAALVTALEGAP
jgi:hypothetical protein